MSFCNRTKFPKGHFLISVYIFFFLSRVKLLLQHSAQIISEDDDDDEDDDYYGRYLYPPVDPCTGAYISPGGVTAPATAALITLDIRTPVVRLPLPRAPSIIH